MFLCIEGFFHNGHEDQTLQFEFNIAPEFNESVLELVGWKSLQDGVEYGIMDLTEEQVQKVSDILGEPMPSELELCISVFA